MSERVLGTAQEEFDIATGYHRQVVRLKDENEQLEERHRQMEEALQACLESLQHIEREMLPEGEKFAEWSHPANSMRMARKALASSEATNRATEGE